jgi:hypothetical protein
MKPASLPARLAAAALGALLWLAAGAAQAALTLEANGQSGTVQVQPGAQVDLEVSANGCPGFASRWRDTWSDPDGIGVPPPAQEESTSSVCQREPTRSFIAPNSPGSSYEVTFTSELCRNGSSFGFPIQCPSNFFGATPYQVFDSSTVTIEIINPAFIGNGIGLLGAYCNRSGANFTVPCTSNPDVTRIDATVDFADGDAGWPAAGIGGNTFSVRWSGQIQAQYTESYRIHTISDDGIRVWVDGNLIINNYTDHAATQNISAPIALVAGQKYDIVIEFYENGGDEVARLLWSSPSTAPPGSPVVVPQTQLYPDVAGVEHYTVSHSGTAITCGAEPITITARDSGGDPIDPGAAVIALGTSTGEGTWARVISGSGVLSGVGAGAGTATYTFPDNGETAVTLAFNYTSVSQASDPEAVQFSVNAGEELPSGGQELIVSRAGFRITDGDGNALAIAAQIAGKPSNVAPGAAALALQAVRAADDDPSQCEPYFPIGADAIVEIGAECNDPDNCAGSELQVSNNANTSAVATSDDNGANGAAAYTPLSLRFGAGAQAPLALRYDDAGRIQLHVRYNPIDDTTPTPPVVSYVIGSSNAWVTRPFGLHVAVAADDATTGANGTLLAVAGDDVDVSVRAVVWQSADDGNADGQPDAGADLSDNGATPNFGNEAVAETVTLSPVVAAPLGGSNGALSGALFAGFSAGSRTQGVSWDEVGHVHLDATLTDLGYLDSGNATGRAASIGRFIPADFAVAVASHGDLDAACGTAFTYTGQPAGYFPAMAPVLTITARNRAAATTTNYRDSYARLTASGVTVTGPVQDSAALGVEGDPIAVTASLDTGVLVANGDGTLSHTFASADRFTVDKVHNARIAPFVPQLQLDVTAVNDGEAAAAPPFLPLAVQPAAIHDIRFGRLAIDAVSGSELAPLEQPLRAQFWNDATWQTNLADGCTVLTLAGEVSLGNDQDGPVIGTQPIAVGGGSTELTSNTADPVTLVGGVAALGFTPPGEGNTGWVDTTLTLDADLPWLRHDWDDVDGADDGPYDAPPAARVTFGIFTGNQGWIHFRRVQ